MADTSIEWATKVWNPVRGCSIVSKGCTNCYAMKQAHRFAGPGGKYEVPLTQMSRGGPVWTGEVRVAPEMLEAPLHWRKPQRVFVNSMSDLFHEDVPEKFIGRVFAVMALCPQHTFQVLTKRPERMRHYLSNTTGPDNVWLGVSVEDQATADERIPLLLETPAVLRWVSYEPALGPVEFGPWLKWRNGCECDPSAPATTRCNKSWIRCNRALRKLDWIVVGGESGPGARPFDVRWARSTVEQCKAAEAPVFVKQLGARPFEEGCEVGHVWIGRNPSSLTRVNDRKGGDPSEWPADLRVREWPEVRS